MFKKICFSLFIGILLLCFCRTDTALAAENSLSDYIEETIENDKDILSSLSPALEKLYSTAVEAFKKLGKLSKEIANVVSMYEALDESSPDYQEDLKKFFDAYNSLAPYKRKIVDALTGVLNAKDYLKDSLKHSVIIDKYSTKPFECELPGVLTYEIDNETIATIKDGTVIPGSIGFTSLKVSNDAGEKVIYRIFVKKPVLASSVKIQKNKTTVITIPDNETVNEIHLSNKKISYSLKGRELTVTGIKAGKSYIYVGTKAGKTLKYKVTVK